jgi:hypothetical protein
MEHSLQILLSLLFVLAFCDWLALEKDVTGKYPPLPSEVYIYALLMPAIRYEGLFLIVVACIALLLRRRWNTVLLLGFTALLCPVFFGIYSMGHDGYFIPNSILIKAVPLPLDGEWIGKFFKDEILNRLFYPYPSRGATAANRLLILIPLVYWQYSSPLSGNRYYRHILYFLFAVTVLHLVFANANLYYRYEAYLVACALVVPSVLFARHSSSLFSSKKVVARCMAVWTLVFLLYPIFSRSWGAYQEAGYGFLHEYQYNYQAARFLHTYYDDATVVIDELGMASFLSRGKKLDLMTGIAYMDITQTRVDGFTRLEYLNFLLKRDKPAIAMIADKKYPPWLIQSWTKVAAWYTSFQLPLGETELDIYAVDPAAVSTLRNNLKKFRISMPEGIKVEFF